MSKLRPKYYVTKYTPTMNPSCQFGSLARGRRNDHYEATFVKCPVFDKDEFLQYLKDNPQPDYSEIILKEIYDQAREISFRDCCAFIGKDNPRSLNEEIDDLLFDSTERDYWEEQTKLSHEKFKATRPGYWERRNKEAERLIMMLGTD